MTVAITGVGVVSAFGIGRAFAPIGPVPAHGVDLAAVRASLPPQGLNFLNRATVLALRAAVEAVDDAGHAGGLPAPAGLVVGTNTPHHESIADQFRHAAATGDIRLIHGLNGNLSIVAARLAIRFHTQGFALSVPSGGVAGLDAVVEGAALAELGRAAVVLAGSVDVEPEGAAAAVFVVLERARTAPARLGLGALLGWAASGAPAEDGPVRRERALSVVRRAIAAAGPIDRVSVSGGASEIAAVHGAFGVGTLPVEGIPGAQALGCAVGAFQLVHALSSPRPGTTLVLNFGAGKLVAAAVAGAGRPRESATFSDTTSTTEVFDG